MTGALLGRETICLETALRKHGEQFLTCTQISALPPTTTLGGRGEDSSFIETEAQGATELLSGEAQALENFKQQLSDLFSQLIFSRGLGDRLRGGRYPYFKYEEN